MGPRTGPPVGANVGSSVTPGQTGTAGAGYGSNATSQNKSTTIPANAVTITILQDASVQGNPAFDPETSQSGIDKTIAWKNSDSIPHTATAQDKSFDSSIINPGDSYVVSAKKIGTGEHAYACTIHPYMKGTLVIR